MAAPRVSIKEFSLANPLYGGGTVSFYTVAGGAATGTLATLFAGATGADQLSNPQMLDSEGKLRQPVYIDAAVVAKVTGLSVSSHQSGIIYPAPTFRVDTATQKVQYSWDGGVSWNDSGGFFFANRGAWAGLGTQYYVTDLVTSGGVLYFCTTAHVSGAAFDATKFQAIFSFDLGTLPAGTTFQHRRGTAAQNDALTGADGEVTVDKTDKTLRIHDGATAGGQKLIPASGVVPFTGHQKLKDSSPTDPLHAASKGYVDAAVSGQPNQQRLVDLLHVDANTGRRDLIAAGWMPAFFNQQWGGAPMPFEGLVDGATGTPYSFDSATGYIDHGTTINVANVAANTWIAQGFKVSKNMSVAAIWVRVAKTGNPANNLELRIMPDDGTGTKPVGSAAIANGTATAISGKLFTSKTDCEWVRFAFAVPPALVAGTQYHVALKSSGAVDAGNFWIWASQGNTPRYPHGNYSQADGTPTWTANTAIDQCFLVEPQTDDQMLLSGGMFGDGKIAFYEGTPLNQSGGFVKAIRNIPDFDPRSDFTLLMRGEAWTKDKTICDLIYGPPVASHDRICIRVDVATGFAHVYVWDTSGTLCEVVATSVDLSNGAHDVAIYVRARGDGADRLDLYVDGAANGAAVTGASITFDPLFRELGHVWIGGGFQPSVVPNQKLDMSVLPSAAAPAWTYSASPVTEANVFSINAGKLFANRNGVAVNTDTPNYSKTLLGLSNAAGWSVPYKVRAMTCSNSKDDNGLHVFVEDGTKGVKQDIDEFYAQSLSLSSNVYPQFDCKSFENVFLMIGKGADYFSFVNGRLLIDGTGLMTSASGNNKITFGDADANAGENADAVWDYLAYYNTAWTPPQFTNGQMSEFAIWSGDRKSILSSVWNGGTPLSVKQFTGVERNFIGEAIPQILQVKGITVSPNGGGAATDIVQQEMEAFVIGRTINQYSTAAFFNSAGASNSTFMCYLDGEKTGALLTTTAPQLNAAMSASPLGRGGRYFGLHKSEGRWNPGGSATNFLSSTQRELITEVTG